MAPFRSDPMANDQSQIVAFSSRGPTKDKRNKPDVVAPGTFVLSTRSTMLAPNNMAWAAFPKSRLYFYMGGTSMATPLVSGAVALLRQYLRTAQNIAVIKKLEGRKMTAQDRLQHFDAWMDPATNQCQQTIYMAKYNETPVEKDDIFKIITQADPSRPFATEGDTSFAAQVLLRRPGGPMGRRNIDWDVQEVMTGASRRDWLRYRSLWFSMLSQGVLRAGAQLTFRLHLQPSDVGWVDMALQTPLLDPTRARTELGWEPQHSAEEAMRDLLNGLAGDTGLKTPPLERKSRAEELAGGVGSRDAE